MRHAPRVLSSETIGTDASPTGRISSAVTSAGSNIESVVRVWTVATASVRRENTHRNAASASDPRRKNTIARRLLTAPPSAHAAERAAF